MNKRKTWLYALNILGVLIVMLTAAQAQSISVTLNGRPLRFGAVPPVSMGGRVLVPLRGVFEALGAQVNYYAASRTISASRGDTNLKLQIGSRTAYVNNSPVMLDVPAQVVSGRTLVPLRFVSEAMGAQVTYQAATRTIAISSTDNGNRTTSTFPPKTPRDMPRIELVQQNAVEALNAGSTVDVTVRGAANMKGTFDLSSQLTNLPLNETSPGVYTGSYTVQNGDDVYQEYVTAHLSSNNGYSVIKQSEEPLTIDTKAPLIVTTVPSDGATIDVAQPNIIIYTDDQNGSGLVPVNLTLTNNGKTYDVNATVAPPQSLRAVAPEALNGKVDVKADLKDAAGNITPVQFTFTVDNTGPISSVNHSATRALSTGDTLTVDMIAPANGRASFDLAREDNTQSIVVQGIPMTQIEPGHYRGTYNVLGTRDEGRLVVMGRFRAKDGTLTVKNATTPVQIVSYLGLNIPIINTPQNGVTVNSPLVIDGSAGAGNIVHVNTYASGTLYYILPYEQDLGVMDVTADKTGKWSTNPLNLPSPKGVSGLKLTITAVQENEAGQISEPATITVQAQ